ncbi:MAG: outer membrane beta-barrel protein [Flavobacterium sp.]
MIKQFVVLFLMFLCVKSTSQNTFTTESSKDKSLPLFFDDFLVVGGLNYGGMFMTKEKSDLSYRTGFHLGFEHYQPIGKKVFLHYGVSFLQKSFRHHQEKVDWTINSMQGLTFASYEIPVLRNYDFRFLLGAHYSYNFNWYPSTSYSSEVLTNPDLFYYDRKKFQNFDFGLFFGLSFERDNYYMRLGSTVGNVKLVNNDQGMYHSLQMSFGYLVFRGARNK